MADKQIGQTLGKIATEVVKHSEAINKLLSDVDGLKEQGLKVVNGQDKMIAILERLDQERLFTFEAVRRIESVVEKHGREISAIREFLKV